MKRLSDILWGEYTPTQRAIALLAIAGLVAACVLAEIIDKA